MFRRLRFRRALPLTALSLLLAGCGSRINQANYDKIATGMTEKEVAAILGPGQESAGSAGIDLGDKSFSLPGGVKVSLPSMPLSGKIMTWEQGDRKICVAFVNGKVASKVQEGL